MSPDRLAVSARRRAGALMFAVPAMFSANMLTARATADAIPPVALAFWRWAAAFALVAAVVGVRRLWALRGAIRAEASELIALGALGMGVCGANVYIAAATTTATNIGIIYAASPVLIILLERFGFGEAMTARQGVGAAACLAGVLLIVARGDLGALLALRFTAGDLWIVSAAIAWAVYTVMLRRRPSRLAPEERFAAIILGGLVSLAPFTVAEAAFDRAPTFDWRTLAAIGFLALVPSFGAYQAYDRVQRALGPARTGLVLYLIPVYNGVLAWALLGERLQGYHLAGAALVLPGLWLATRR